MGLHKATIARGAYGELSKVREELEEAEDAEAQGLDLMLFMELSDIIGAVEGVANRRGVTLAQLLAWMEARKAHARASLELTGGKSTYGA